MRKSLKHKPYNRLKGDLREKGITYSNVATLLNISETAFSHKINGISDFYITEMEQIISQYGISHTSFLT